MSQRRVVVTGMGAVTPVGQSVDAFWDALLACRSGVRNVTLFDTTPFDVHFGGEVADFDPTVCIDRRQVKRLDRFAQFAMVAGADSPAWNRPPLTATGSASSSARESAG
jgi:3-oxoacyl-[acyl-carrier-protein] synthase II